MARMNVDYDLLTWEGDILRLKFWARAFDILRDSGAMFKQESGKLAGCWVMRIDEDLAIGERGDGDAAAESDGSADERDEDEARTISSHARR